MYAEKTCNGAVDKLKVRINSHGDGIKRVFAVGKTEKTPEQIVRFLMENGLKRRAGPTVFTLFACETAYMLNAVTPTIAERFRNELQKNGIINFSVTGSPFVVSGSAFPVVGGVKWDTISGTKVQY
jgi:hypothetical protein